MRTVFKSSLGVLLAALLLGWTTFCEAGLVAHCDGSPSAACKGAALHAMSDHHDHHTDGILPDCGCPPDHQHTAVGPDMVLLSTRNGVAPRWLEPFAGPQPPDRSLLPEPVKKPGLIPEPIPPAASPPHLACSPLLI